MRQFVPTCAYCLARLPCGCSHEVEAAARRKSETPAPPPEAAPEEARIEGEAKREEGAPEAER